MNKKGFSLVEVIISIAVILIVSISTITIISKIKVNNEVSKEVTIYSTYLENVLEIFKGSSNLTEFENNLTKLEMLDSFEKSINTEKLEYINNGDKVTLTINVDYQENQINCLIKSKRKTYLEISYEK